MLDSRTVKWDAENGCSICNSTSRPQSGRTYCTQLRENVLDVDKDSRVEVLRMFVLSHRCPYDAVSSFVDQQKLDGMILFFFLFLFVLHITRAVTMSASVAVRSTSKPVVCFRAIPAGQASEEKSPVIREYTRSY